MDYEVLQEFGIPVEHYTGSLRIDSRYYSLAMVAIHGFKQGSRWEAVASTYTTGRDEKILGEILFEPNLPRENVLLETEKWIRKSGEAIWLPNYIKPLSSGFPSIAVHGLLAVCKIEYKSIDSLSS